MGCNYYWYPKPPCPHCGLLDEARKLHIGKSSFGWRFGLHVREPLRTYDEIPANLDEWKKLFELPGCFIVDECGKAVTPQEMLDIIINRNDHRAEGRELRRRPLDWWCIANAKDGDYDLVIGDFS